MHEPSLCLFLIFFFGQPQIATQTPALPRHPAASQAESTAVTPGQGKGSPLTACHCPAAQRCVGHAARWQSRCGGGRLAGSHSESSAAVGLLLWHCTDLRWTPRPQDTEHCGKGHEVSAAPSAPTTMLSLLIAMLYQTSKWGFSLL